jgi:hypothetical protein
MVGMKKHFLAVAIAVIAMSAVLASAVATASLGATAAGLTATKLSLSVSKSDIYAGDSVTVRGKLNDPVGMGIPNQVIHVAWTITADNQTYSGHNDTKTNASGDFGATANLHYSNVPSKIKQVTIELATAYDGNAWYAASQSAPVTVTVHLK